MNATALFLESGTRLEPRPLQPLPDASEAGWDRWMMEVAGADFLTWRTAQEPRPKLERQLKASLLDD